MNFGEQSAAWLRGLETRRRKPVSAATLATYSSYIRRLLPVVGADTPLASITNGFMKDLVSKLTGSPKTVNEALLVVRTIVASALDPQTGDPLYPRQWNHTFIDAPTISKQKQPSLSVQQVNVAIKDAESLQEKVLYAVLAGTGIRISEVLAIRVGQVDEDQTAFLADDSTLKISASIYCGTERRGVLKTASAKRDVDLDPRLSAFIMQFVAAEGIQAGEYLFQSKSGRSMHLPTATRRLKKRGVKGFHAFRRHRITRLRELGTPEDILRFWVGHEGTSISDRYSKLAENLELRKQWAARVGLGFEIPAISEEHPAPLENLKPPNRHTTILSLSDALPAESSYKAEDSDLDPFFAEAV